MLGLESAEPTDHHTGVNKTITSAMALRILCLRMTPVGPAEGSWRTCVALRLLPFAAISHRLGTPTLRGHDAWLRGSWLGTPRWVSNHRTWNAATPSQCAGIWW